MEAYRSFTKKLNKEDVLENNEIQANVLAAFSMLFFSILVFLFWCLCRLGCIGVRDAWRLLYIDTELIIPALICRHIKGQRVWLKYVLLLELVLVVARLNTLLGYNVKLLIILPTVLACRYFSGYFMRVVALFTTVTYGLSSFIGAFFETCDIDLNYYFIKPGTMLQIQTDIWRAIYDAGIDRIGYTVRYMSLSLFPEICMYSLIALICIRIAQKGREMVLEQAAITQKSARMETELTLANNIQTHMLPTIFPPSVGSKEIELFASMDPAKSVGGDFYDFFMVDDRNMAMVIADVSGKGVPAALLMVITKILIKNEVNMGGTPEEVFTKVNHLLCEGNEDSMFVTAWLGILDTETGLLTYVNAGHNPPLIKLADAAENGKEPLFEYLNGKPGFILGGMDGLRYHQRKLQMRPQDALFLYTDGATEAKNEAEAFYGADRLRSYLNEHRFCDSKSLLKGVREDIRSFSGKAEQFDDITLMSVRYLSYKKKDEMVRRSFPADTGKLDDVLRFVDTELQKGECSRRIQMQIALCVEEIFVNIARYAYSQHDSDVLVTVKREDDVLTLQFIDHGIPFNPLRQKMPDVTAAPADREVGGLGIFLVKEKMDEVRYDYQNGRNILMMKKRMGAGK